jgi:hypothetical protein
MSGIRLPQNNDEYLIKTDHQLTPSHRVTLSYFRFGSATTIVQGGLTSSWTYSNYAATQQNANVSDTWTISPRTVNQAWLSYTRQFGGRIPVPTPIRGLLSAPTSASPAFRHADRSVHSGWFGLTQAITGPKAGTNQYGVRDVLNTTRGKHTLYLGGEGGLEKDFQQTSLNNYGVFAFTTAAGSRTNYIPVGLHHGLPQLL